MFFKMVLFFQDCGHNFFLIFHSHKPTQSGRCTSVTGSLFIPTFEVEMYGGPQVQYTKQKLGTEKKLEQKNKTWNRKKIKQKKKTWNRNETWNRKKNLETEK